MAKTPIDTTFDFRSDTPPGTDPDSYSPTLRAYHRQLWSKQLPNGEVFELDATTPRSYLHHRSSLGEFSLSSDAVIPTFTRELKMAGIIAQISASDYQAFSRVSYTIGGMMIFPAQRVGGAMTINGARGFHPRIKDRFDLTVECIRRHYLGLVSPLSETLARYGDFFDLFGDFRGYTEFFLLQDMVNDPADRVEFFAPFDDFAGSPLLLTLDKYIEYREAAIEFIQSRNRRIDRWWAIGAGREDCDRHH